MQYVIIGNSTAATFAIEGIRAIDRAGSITVISDETRPAYGRPLISYYLYGRIRLENTAYRPASFYTDNGVTLEYGVRAEKIDPKMKTVALSDGSTIGYDKLLVATGSSPLVPPADGLDAVKYHTFMTMDAALALEKELSPEKRVLVVGAGLIGLKCVEGILDRVGSVTVVDLAARILPSILDEEGSAIVQERLEARGVNFVLGDCAVRYAPGLATLRSGKEVPFDILVIAAGVRPNVSLVREAGGEVNRGIVVNDRQETTIPDVYAAGDNCESYDICSGTRRILALLPNAAFQGETAGRNMAGGDAAFDKAAPFNALGLFDTHIATEGVYEGEAYTDLSEGYKKLFVKDNKLVGFILIDCIERAGIYTSLTREQTPLDTVDFELLKKNPVLMAFARGTREEYLTRRR
ncbi:MAG TPA: FAD-dependent oxidoreductase [Candidatus Gallimonas intestinigallinarum]|uniref:FAD-dependent oxidoreductase n=1 Tax=Candidatus Gallimonas intestinigallinarum TaxID=2838604 RepID=A0A9D2DVZ4_9FIRM|nr:FAD-dependent oxidoreductase [Candidatus Gallimonas intestinigallinarum]